MHPDPKVLSDMFSTEWMTSYDWFMFSLLVAVIVLICYVSHLHEKLAMRDHMVRRYEAQAPTVLVVEVRSEVESGRFWYMNS